MRIGTWQVAGGDDPSRGGAVLAAAELDVLGLVAPSRRVIRHLARSSGLHVAATSGRQAMRTALLVGDRVSVRTTRRLALLGGPGAAARTVSQAILSVDSSRLGVAVVALGARAEERLDQVDQVLELLDSLDVETAVLGDLNGDMAGPAGQRLLVGHLDAWATTGRGLGLTYPAGDPATRRHVVLVPDGWSVQDVEVLADDSVLAASRHLPVVASVSAPGESVPEDDDDDGTDPQDQQ